MSKHYQEPRRITHVYAFPESAFSKHYEERVEEYQKLVEERKKPKRRSLLEELLRK